ncbi:MAG: hypothetical protein AAGK33_15175 [Pseudomonadota bacterium]
MAKKAAAKKAPPTRYVHIGFPKSASTSLQNFYFPKHEQIYHMGNGYEGRGNAYVDEDVEMVCEVDIRYKRECLWDPQLSAERLAPHFQYAVDEGYKAVGISSEFFCFPLSNEVDTAEKARRLKHVLGDGAKVVIIIREQYSLLKSLYKEMLKGGYPGTYRKFLEYTLLYQVRSWCYDFCFDILYDHYADLFGEENVCMIPFEILKQDNSIFLGRISDALGIDHTITELKSVNEAKDSLGFYEQLRRYNERFPHEFGSAFYEPFSMNRMRAYFHNELELAVPHDRLADDFMRMPINQAAEKFTGMSPLADIDLRVPKGLKDQFDAIYGPSNQRLNERLGDDMAKLGYFMG